jgi:hypothetical protein
MRNSRPQSYHKFGNNTFNDFQFNFSKTSTGFYKPNMNRTNNFPKNFRIFSSNVSVPKFKEKLFSLLDVNDKVTDSRGTSLPIQYKRLTEEENKRQFGFLYREEQNQNLALIKNFLNNMNMSKYKIKKDNKENKKDKENAEIKEGKTKEKKLEIKIEHSNKEKEKIKIKSAEINSRIKNNKSEESKTKIKVKNRNDLWLPKGYPEYELLVQNPKLLKKYLKNNYFANHIPEFTLTNIRQKQNESDIFFKNPITFKESLYNKRIKPNNYNSSDIFHLKYSIENLAKCSEKYLFKEKPKDKYYITRESESKWSPKTPFLGFMNSPSTEYNILNPSKKNTIGYTREKIVTEINSYKDKIIEDKKLDRKISKSVNYMNPIYRQKGIGEFIDITRNGGNNVGKDFLGFYNRNDKCFSKNNEVGATFYDSYLFYKDICEKPFTLTPTLKMN